MYLCVTLVVLGNNFVSAKEELIVGMGHREVEFDNKDIKEQYIHIIHYYRRTSL